jgi:hypothetical protein
VVAVGAVALTGDDDSSADGPPAGLTLADLEPALLTADDVGPGFQLEESGDEGEDVLGSNDFEASEECEIAFDAFEANQADREELGVEFTNVEDGSFQHDLSIPHTDEASLAEVRSTIEECDTLRLDDEELSGELRFETSDVDAIGDDAMGMTIEVDIVAQGFPFSFTMYGILWERDGVHSTLAGFGGFDQANLAGIDIDPGRVEELARTVDQRLADVLSG